MRWTWASTFFDTAKGYSAGTSEEYLGCAIKRNISREKVVIASKVYFNPGRLSREAIHSEVDGTLKRLGTDYLDLYIIHHFDYETPIEETMEALHELVKAGKVRALGTSAMYGYQFYNMQLAAWDNAAHQRDCCPAGLQQCQQFLQSFPQAVPSLSKRIFTTATSRSVNILYPALLQVPHLFPVCTVSIIETERR